MSILISWLGPLRAICMAIDGVAFSLLDNAYQIVINLSTAELFQHETIRSITNNLYILIGVVAFFRLALVLVNAIIDPEKLNEKGKGLSNIFFRVVGMVILLAVTPFLFQLSYELQGKIVGGDPDKNIIFKTILGDNANIGGQNAGKALQNIALSSLITVNENYYEDFDQLKCVSNGDGTCTNQGGYVYGKECDWDNCYAAVSLYNDLYVNEDMSPTKLAKYAGVSTKIDGEEVYVYDYMMIVTTVVGIFMTYIIISFAIDIAVRMFELLVLEVLSPLFIATFVDPKSSQSGPFKNWLSAVGKSYANLYIKLAILALIILLISLVNQSKIFNSMGDLSGWTKIFVVIGLLIFAKKAPKWIMDMIGIKSDESGLGGLSIGKKLGGMALAGGLVNKARDGIKGGLKKQGDKILDHGKKRLGNMANKALGAYAARKTVKDAAKDKYRKDHGINDGDKMKLADRYKAYQAARSAAKSADTKNKVKATKAQVQAEFVADNDMRAFASLKDKFAEHAQRINPQYKTKREKDLEDLNSNATKMLKGANMDPDTMNKRKKDAQDIRKANAIYGADYVREHGLKADGTLDKSVCPINEQQVNNAYSGILGHAPTSIKDVAQAQLIIEYKSKGIIKNISDLTDAEITRKIENMDSYPKALYNSAVFENNCLTQSNYIDAVEGKTKADQELAELYSQMQTYQNNRLTDFETDDDRRKYEETYEKAMSNFENLIEAKNEDVRYYTSRINDSKKEFVAAFGEALTIDSKGKLINNGGSISEEIIKNNDSVVEINGEYVTKFGRFKEIGKDGEGKPLYDFVQEDMSQQLELINNEQDGKRNGKIKTALENAKPPELKSAEKDDSK